MKRLTLVLSALSLAAASAFAAPDWMGRWEGGLELAEGRMSFGLSLVEGGGLLDLPDANLYGYPSAKATISGDSLSISFRFGAGDFTLSGTWSGDRVEGIYTQGSGGGSFFMLRSSFQPDATSAVSMRGRDGSVLAGTLLSPPGTGAVKPPLVILHAGLGSADRDGNNYNVPGKNDALRLLARGLREAGVASYRYDKRGTGASTWLVRREEEQSFEAWIDDLAAVARAFDDSGRYSGVWLLGLNDGALVAVAAANRLAASGAPVDGVIVACASADGSLDAYRKAVESAPDERRAEGEALIASLLAGRSAEAPSAFYASAFRPSFQPYLMEAFRFDIEAELARFAGPCFIVQGDMDMQASLADFIALRKAAPEARAAIVPGMNHVLKEVDPAMADNQAAFSDPSYSVPAALVDAIAEFVGGL